MSAISTDRFKMRRSTSFARFDPYNNIKKSFNFEDNSQGYYFFDDLDRKVGETQEGHEALIKRLRYIENVLSKALLDVEAEYQFQQEHPLAGTNTYYISLEALIQLGLVSQADKQQGNRTNAQRIIRNYRKRIRYIRNCMEFNAPITLKETTVYNLRRFFEKVYSIATTVNYALAREERSPGCF